MRSLQESLLDDEEDLIDNTNALSAIDFPKYSDLIHQKISYSGLRSRTTDNYYEWNIPKNLRKNYMVKDSEFEKVHPKFTPYKLTVMIDSGHQYLGLKLNATELSTYDKCEIVTEYDINLFFWNNSFNLKNKYRVLAYNALELLATYPEVLSYILIDRDNNPGKEYFYHYYGVELDRIFKKYNWKIKKYR